MPRLFAPTALVAVLVAAVPAAAQQPVAATPPPSGAPEPRCGTAFIDPSGDNNGAPADKPTEQDSGDVNGDILKGWFDYDGAKGAKGITANLQISDLSKRVGTPHGTGTAWNFTYDVGDKTHFVRALVDFSGGPYYEYGVYQVPVQEDPGPPPENPMPLARYAYQGTTEGTFKEGKNGVISIVIPKAAGGEQGKELKEPWATASLSRGVVPGTVTQAPTRGVTTPIDTAPDEAAKSDGGTAWTVNDCTPLDQLKGQEEPPVVEVVQKAAAPAPAPAAEPAPAAQPAPVPYVGAPTVTLLTKTARRAKKGKVLALRLRGSAPLVGVAAQLRKGRTSLGYARLARMPGTGTLKLKLTRALKKGTYTLDIAGSSENGRVLTTAKLVVR